MNYQSIILHCCLFFIAHLSCSKESSIPLSAAIPNSNTVNRPDYLKKNSNIINRNKLPDGFIIYARNDTSGIYLSKTNEYKPKLLKNTASLSVITCIQISDDGRWMLYKTSKGLKLYKTSKLFMHNFKTGLSYELPTSMVFGQAGFLRNSPFGNEVFYLENPNKINALQFTLTGDSITFGQERILYDDKSYGVYWGYDIGLAIVGDQIMAEMCLESAERGYPARTAYVTIPDSGRGVATSKNMYRWLNEDTVMLNGCGNTMSHDGVYSLANPMLVGHDEYLPHKHRGFCITPFRRYGSKAIDVYDEHYLKYGTSINWCPEEYRNYLQPAVDFWFWYFCNDDRYVIGKQDGTSTPFKGLWMVEWRTNNWYQLTPETLQIPISSNAAFIGIFDTTMFAFENSDSLTNSVEIDSSLLVGYRVISPNGGEVFKCGDTCIVKVTAKKEAMALLFLTINGGRTRIIPEEFTTSINPYRDSTYAFIIPETFLLENGDELSAVSNRCKIVVTDYAQASDQKDESDDYFMIIQ